MTGVYNSNRSGSIADQKTRSETPKRVTDVRSGSMPTKGNEAFVPPVSQKPVRTKIITRDGRLLIVESK